jgi:hypothetical protein
VPAQQVQNPEFKAQYHKKGRKEGRKERKKRKERHKHKVSKAGIASFSEALYGRRDLSLKR